MPDLCIGDFSHCPAVNDGLVIFGKVLENVRLLIKQIIMGTKTLLAATAAGIALGMIMAPEKGTDTQKKVADSFGKLKDKWNDITNLKNVKADDLRELKETFKQHIAGLSEDVRKKVLQIIENTKPAKEDMKAQPAEEIKVYPA